uniref:phenylalanine--tRNA ligase n=1 Tax=Pleonosporium borreri TaxID=2575635 RepID=A0A4D6WWD8_9FLOR|nr:Phenylalanine-tRNA ligase beta subunit [Pleonosporium borreri]
MQISCKLLNKLINLNHITLEKLEHILALRGFEIENITENIQNQDKIINFNVTANRRELSNITRIAQEISIILNIPLQSKIINLSKYIQYSYHDLNSNSFNIIKYVIIHHIKSIQNQIMPQRIQEYINKPNNNLLCNIQRYIKIKWAQDLYYIPLVNNSIDLNNLILQNKTNLFQISTKTENKILFQLQSNQIANYKYNNLDLNNSKSVLLILPVYNYQHQQYNNIDYFFNSYQEIIQLLTTYGQYQFSKSYTHNYTIKYQAKILYFNKNYILNILGPISDYKLKKLKYFNTKQILYLLKQLCFEPQYYNKTFKITIPTYREHDLTRKIDIVEEIARIYGFDKFINKIPQTKHKGKISITTKLIQKIRYILRHAGFKEVVNSSLSPLNKKTFNKNNNVILYNPMTEEQPLLRTNLLNHLIHNYNYHIKHNSKNLAIFEIGKIFYKKNNKIIEELNLSGLVYNSTFMRTDWTNIAKNINWFHAKGILEDFLEKIGATYYWKIIYINKYMNLNNYLNYQQQLGIYSKINHNLIGILTQLKPKINTNIKENYSIYVFEFYLNQLIQNISIKKTINYIIKPYSLYPSVTRDISININNKNSLVNIKQNIQKKYQHLIESIDIINVYYNPKLKLKSLCLRITYKAVNRTLNNKDIQNIDKNLNQIIKISI